MSTNVDTVCEPWVEGAVGVPVKSPMGTRMMSTMRGSTISSLTSLAIHVRHSTDQLTCTCASRISWMAPVPVQGRHHDLASLAGSEGGSGWVRHHPHTAELFCKACIITLGRHPYCCLESDIHNGIIAKRKLGLVRSAVSKCT